jgi:hypothetical protein
MRVLGPKIDLLIQGAIAVAQAFGQKAQDAGIKEEWEKAGAALAGLFGDAASTLGDALDLGARLLDPETQIPSIGQIQGKLDALLNLAVGVAQQFAARASSLAAGGVDTKAAGVLAEQVKAIFDSLSTVAQTVQDFTGIAIGSSGFNNIRALLDNVFGLFANVAGQADVANSVTAAITSLLGGLQALVSNAGFSAGQSWAEKFAEGVTAMTSTVQDAVKGAVGGGVPGPTGTANQGTGGTGSGGPSQGNQGTGGTTIYQTVNVNLSTAMGLPQTLELLLNMAKG